MHLGYLSAQGVVQHKGRVACQLNAHEVFLTELLHENIFADCTVEETVALLSSLVFQQVRMYVSLCVLTFPPSCFPHPVESVYTYVSSLDAVNQA